MRYDYLIAGAGLFGAVFAHEMTKAGKNCYCIDRRAHIGGNIYTEEWNGIQVHKYGAHIFHTSDKAVWDYVNQFAEFNHYINSPVAVYGDELYNLPFNMNTFSKMWGIKTPDEAKAIIEAQRAEAVREMRRPGFGAVAGAEIRQTAAEDGAGACKEAAAEDDGGACKGEAAEDDGGACKGEAAEDGAGACKGEAAEDGGGACKGEAAEDGGGSCKEAIAENDREPANLEEQALSLVGRDVYEKLVKGYTEKQWGRSCRELPAFIIKRLPVRFTYDNNYFTDRYQGIPAGGYTQIIAKLLEGIPVRLGVSYRDFLKQNEESSRPDTFGKILYTGMIDEYFDYRLGELQYRSLRFEEEFMEECDNYQGNAVVNYTDREVPYTRIIEHKHFEFGVGKGTVITREYPSAWERGQEPYYPVNDAENTALYEKYRELAAAEQNVLFGGRLGQYRYYDMDKVIAEALKMAEDELKCR